MALFFPDDPDYSEGHRMTGFNRYRQLLSFHAREWFYTNLLTTIGFIPLGFGIFTSIITSSILLLLPLSIVGGIICAPFYACLVDTLLRGLRDATGKWWDNYKKSWKQNWKESLFPGALMGLFLGIFVFMIYMIWSSNIAAGKGTIALLLFSILVFFIFFTLYWAQLVLFRQTGLTRIRNIILFTSKYLWRVLGAAAIQILWYGILFLFMPFSLILIPFLGFWHITFVSLFSIYDQLNEELNIEESFQDSMEW